MNLLARFFRRPVVAGPKQLGLGPIAAVAAPRQLRLDALWAQIQSADAPSGLTHLMAQADELEGVLVDRNLAGQDLERQGRIEDAAVLYEANVADCFAGSHPYERLLVIYAKAGRQDDARRVAQACMRWSVAGMSAKLKARCEKVLG